MMGSASVVDVVEGFAPFGAYEPGIDHRLAEFVSPALVVAHGGPGCTHDYVDSLKHIAELDGRGGHSFTNTARLGQLHPPPDKGADFWTIQLFPRSARRTAQAPRHRPTARLSRPVLGRACSARSTRYDAALRASRRRSSPTQRGNMHTWVSEANRLREELPP